MKKFKSQLQRKLRGRVKSDFRDDARENSRDDARENSRVKRGAASFYLVAVSMVILLILATGFAITMISQSERSSNDDLSQSAYDSALAGIEDAKLAFYQYQKCVSGSGTNCSYILTEIEDTTDCDMVANILGRGGTEENGGVVIEESTGENNMQQVYTCVTIDTTLSDYRATLNSSTDMKVVKLEFTEAGTAAKIKSMKISWYAADGDTTYRYTNVFSGGVTFPQIGLTYTATPPTISVALIQTANEFLFSDFDVSVGNTTDRGMVYLVPTNNKTAASSGTTSNSYGEYRAGYNGTENHLSSSAFVKSNDHTTENLPYMVYCNGESGDEFACSVTIDLPEPVNGNDARNDDTFYIVVALPYGRPDTDFALEFYCNDGVICGTETVTAEDGSETKVSTNQATLDGVQVKIDSTGRANDLYRRVETRLESSIDAGFVSLLGPLQLYSDDSGSGSSSSSGSSKPLLEKDLTVTTEWGSD